MDILNVSTEMLTRKLVLIYTSPILSWYYFNTHKMHSLSSQQNVNTIYFLNNSGLENLRGLEFFCAPKPPVGAQWHALPVHSPAAISQLQALVRSLQVSPWRGILSPGRSAKKGCYQTQL